MAQVIRSLRRTLLFPSPKTTGFLIKPNSQISTRNYSSEMRKSAFEGNILRLIRNEIRYELDSTPINQIINKFGFFSVDDRPGEQWVSLKRQFGKNENIKVEATMFDGSIPAPKFGGNLGEDVELHITLVVNISKGGDDVLEVVCSAWPGSIEITKVFIRKLGTTRTHPYIGPEFRDLDDEMQNSIYDFLEERGINDELADFLHQYMKNKDKTECIRWMRTVKSFIETK